MRQHSECNPEAEAAYADLASDIFGFGDDEKDFEDRSLDAAHATHVGQAVGGLGIYRAQREIKCEKCPGRIAVDQEFTSTWWHGGEVHMHATCSTCQPIKRAPKGRR